jgi:hypothetical protein
VKAQGGLRIIATERHESRRIDNQLRGRSGRQGDPGSSRFYLSLDDPLMRIFAGDRVRAIMERLKMPDGEAIEAGIVTRSIESAQRKVEARNFDIRKQLLEYDDVSNDQRKVIYQQRNDILDAGDLATPRSRRCAKAASPTWCASTCRPSRSRSSGTCRPGEGAGRRVGHRAGPAARKSRRPPITDEDIVEKVIAGRPRRVRRQGGLIGQENFTQFERMVLLQSIDTHWREHLASLDYLRQGIHLRGYAQKQPKQEYKREAFELFGQLLDSVKNEVTKVLMTVRCSPANSWSRPPRTWRARRAHRQRHLHRAHRDRRGRGARGRELISSTPPKRTFHAREPVCPSHPATPCIAVPGVRIGVAEAGVRKANRKDLTVVLIDEGAAVGGVFTQNRFCAAPVQVCRDHLAANVRHPRDGDQHRQRQRRHRRGRPGAHAHHLHRAGAPSEHRARADPAVLDRRDHGAAAGGPHRGRPAGRARRCVARPLGARGRGHHDHRHRAQGLQPQVQVGGATVTVTGISKGAGMIRPNMATMLGFMATDAKIDPALIQPLAKRWPTRRSTA